MWSHLERQAGGRVRGMGEKQLEIDKRLLRARMARLRLNLDDTRRYRYPRNRAGTLSLVLLVWIHMLA